MLQLLMLGATTFASSVLRTVWEALMAFIMMTCLLVWRISFLAWFLDADPEDYNEDCHGSGGKTACSILCLIKSLILSPLLALFEKFEKS
jgi:hypothetical protein